MKRESRSYGIGDVQVSRIDELTLNVFPFEGLYPGADPTLLQRHRHRLGPGSFNSEAGVFTQSIHTWLVRTPRHTILIDTSTDNDKASAEQRRRRVRWRPLHRGCDARRSRVFGENRDLLFAVRRRSAQAQSLHVLPQLHTLSRATQLIGRSD